MWSTGCGFMLHGCPIADSEALGIDLVPGFAAQLLEENELRSGIAFAKNMYDVQFAPDFS